MTGIHPRSQSQGLDTVPLQRFYCKSAKNAFEPLACELSVYTPPLRVGVPETGCQFAGTRVDVDLRVTPGTAGQLTRTFVPETAALSIGALASSMNESNRAPS